MFCVFMLIFFNRRLGWDPKQGEGHLDAMLRGELLIALAAFGHDATINEANRRFHIFLEDRNTPVLPPDLRKVMISTLKHVFLNIVLEKLIDASSLSFLLLFCRLYMWL